MKRRAFITLLGGTVIVWPLAARAQRGERVRRLGFISTSTTTLDSPLLLALLAGLRQRGYEEGKNLHIEYYFAQSRDQLPAMAAQLIAKKVEIIIAAGSEGIVAARDATKTIPIVMTNSGDAVRAGFVSNLRKPGGNITGMTQISPEMAGKRLEMLREIFPDLKRVGIFWNPIHPNAPIAFQETVAAAEKLGLLPISVETTEPSQIQPALAKVAADGVRALLVIRDPFTVRNRATIINTLHSLHMLAVFETYEFLEAGGLMFYGADFEDLFWRSAVYVDQILRGTNPSDLPVQQPTKFLLGINNRIALERGITLPETLLARADRIVE
jgi:putative tryptophan/tyrosine transport system substrate-binding protein